MPEGSPGSPEQPVNGVREASTGFINRMGETLNRMHTGTKAVLFFAVLSEGLAIKSFLEGDPANALAKGILGGVFGALAVLMEKGSRRLDAQSARIRAEREAAENEQTGS